MIFNDHINFFPNEDIKYVEKLLIKSLNNPIKIKFAVITKNFNTDILFKYYPDIKIKYLEDIDEFYIKYCKYKTKYLILKEELKTSLIDNDSKKNYDIVNSFLNKKDICTDEDILINKIIFLSEEKGITKGYGGAYLLGCIIESVECVAKLFTIKEKNIHTPDSNINEIGITHFISDYFLSNPNKKITDNFIIFYGSKRCTDFLLQKNPLNIMLSELNNNTNIFNKDINIMIVEKVFGDLYSYLDNVLIKKNNKFSDEDKKNTIKILDSIFFQIIYALFVFNKEFGEFVHGDLHLGNILVSLEKKLTKKYNIKMILDQTESDDSINSSDGYIEYLIEIETFGITPKIYDFATTYVKKINDICGAVIKKSDLSNNIAFLDKYFSYRKDNNLIYYPNLVKNNDMYFLFSSIIKKLNYSHYMPEEYIIELDSVFKNNSIDKIFKIFLFKMNTFYKNNNINENNCDYLYIF